MYPVPNQEGACMTLLVINGSSSKQSGLRGAVLVSLAAIATIALASEPHRSDALRPNTELQQEQWAHAEKLAGGKWADSSRKPAVDRSGAQRVGKASFYANFFAGRKMADGKIMNPHAKQCSESDFAAGYYSQGDEPRDRQECGGQNSRSGSLRRWPHLGFVSGDCPADRYQQASGNRASRGDSDCRADAGWTRQIGRGGI